MLAGIDAVCLYSHMLQLCPFGTITVLNVMGMEYYILTRTFALSL